jgi:geranylgeranyl diphosphate synthase type I
VANRTLAPPAISAGAAAGLTTQIEWALTDFLTGEVAALTAVDPALSLFARTARDSVLAGGKRLRPVFAYWGWRGLTGRSAAVLVGDLCLIWADRLMSTAAVPAQALAEARGCYDQMRIEAVAGQYLDVLGEADPGSWSVERALRVARHKTASYTVLRPLRFGAALAGEHGPPADRRAAVLRAYDRYGAAVGEAFQLRDDLLGVYGDPKVTGKPAGEDLRTGKPTALLMMARQLADRGQRRDLDRALAAAQQNHTDTDGLPALIAQTGAVDRIEAMIEERMAAALAALAAAPVSSGARQALHRLASAAAHRRA